MQVVLAANNGPTINDITAAELAPLVESAAAVDSIIADAWASKQLLVINSGNDLPVIDLRQVCVWQVLPTKKLANKPHRGTVLQLSFVSYVYAFSTTCLLEMAFMDSCTATLCTPDNHTRAVVHTT